MVTHSRKIQDKVADVLEKCSSQRSRAGNVVERVGKMVAGRVPNEVIAMQLTANSPPGEHYTSEEVKTLCKVWRHSYSRTLVTAKQTTALIEDVRDNFDNSSNLSPSVC